MHKNNLKSNRILHDQKTVQNDVNRNYAGVRKIDGCHNVHLKEEPGSKNLTGSKIPTGRKNQPRTRNQPENKKVFICSPFRPEGKNDEEKKIWSVIDIMIAMLACDNAVERGYLPLCPHLYFPYLFLNGDPIERDLGLRFGKEWLDECDEIWVVGDQITEGMAEQIEYATELGKPMENVCVPAEIVSTFAEIAYSWSATDEDDLDDEDPDEDLFEEYIFDDFDDFDDLNDFSGFYDLGDFDDWLEDYNDCYDTYDCYDCYDCYDGYDGCDGCNGCDDDFRCRGCRICDDMEIDDFLY